MKRTLALILSVLLVLQLAGCGGTPSTSTPVPTESTGTPTEKPAETNPPTEAPTEVPTEVPAVTPAVTPVDTQAPAVSTIVPTENTPKAISYGSEEEWYTTMLEESVVSNGNNRRLKSILNKALNGEQVTIAAIGGSITEGAGASKYQDCYAYKTFESIKSTYGAGNGSNVKFINAGIGGTPSTFGVLRYSQDVLSKVEGGGSPDIVFVEFAVNDSGEPTGGKAYESLVKSILMSDNAPIVILVFAVFPSGYNIQSTYQRIGKKYDLMMVSVKDGMWSELQDASNTKVTQSTFFADQYHPTTYGHGIMSDMIMYNIQKAYAAEASATDIDTTVKPVFGDDYLNCKLIRPSTTGLDMTVGSFNETDSNIYSPSTVGNVYKNSNFCHKSNSGSDSMTIKVNTKNLLLTYKKSNSNNAGTIEVYVDGVLKKTINSYDSGAWNNYDTVEVFRGTTVGEHTIEIKMAAGSEKKEFTLVGLAYTDK